MFSPLFKVQTILEEDDIFIVTVYLMFCAGIEWDYKVYISFFFFFIFEDTSTSSVPDVQIKYKGSIVLSE